MLMKRIAVLFLIFSLCLTGCDLFGEDPTAPVFTTVPPETTETVPETTESDPYAPQLALIWQEMDSWIKDPYADAWCYAVTDLDGNGLLEFISSDTQGSGHFTATRMWEVSADGATLAPVENSNEYGGGIALTSGYQSGGTETVPCFRDPATGAWYYIQKTTVHVSTLEYVETTYAVSFCQGQLSRLILGTMTTTFEPNSVTYTDSDGNAITEAEYVAIAETHFAGYPTTNAKICWLDCVAIGDLTEDMLKTSWEGFSWEKA